jgi:GNAT superfamily N-acetyltransferase
MSGVIIRPVATRRDLSAFVELPYRLYSNQANWVAPLRFERRRFLDRSKNPYFEHARAEYFLAERAGRVVGRVTAQVDEHFQEVQGSKGGHFGFFESEQDPEAAAALLDAAARWLTAQGCDAMVGPQDFTMNDECGLLVEGHGRPPIIGTGWHHPYYQGLLEGAGLTKAMDLYMWELRIEGRKDVLPIIWELADKLEPEHGITLRHASKRDLEAEMRRFVSIYNVAWERNWGFSPMTEAEIAYAAKTLKPILDEHWMMFAEKDGEAIGVAVTVPDFNQVLLAIGNGRLLPLGWAKALRARKKVDRVRVGFLGVRPEWQHAGVAAGLYKEHFDMAEVTPQKWGGDGLDPRDERRDEPGHGGHGRADRPALPDVRAPARRRGLTIARSRVGPSCTFVRPCDAPISSRPRRRCSTRRCWTASPACIPPCRCSSSSRRSPCCSSPASGAPEWRPGWAGRSAATPSGRSRSTGCTGPSSTSSPSTRSEPGCTG